MSKRLNDERSPSSLQLESVGMSLKPELESLLRHSNLDARVEYRVACPPSVEVPSLAVSVAVESEDQVEEAVKALKKIFVSNNIARTEGFASQAFTMECPIPPGTWPSDWDKIAFRDITVVVSVSSSPDITAIPETLPFSPRSVAAVETLMESTSSNKNPVSFQTLLLSGGGYRATAYHIGVLRWLYEHSLKNEEKSLLSLVTNVVGVSGGSISAGHFTHHYKTYLSHFKSAVLGLVDFLVTTDIRTNVLENGTSVQSLLSPLFPNDSAFQANDCPASLHILGTSLKTGETVAFTRTGIALLHSSGVRARSNATSDLTTAIAASSAFPPFMPSVILNDKTIAVTGRNVLGELQHIWVADGGIRDNLGIEYANLVGLDSNGRVLASDAGFLFDSDISDFGSDERLSLWLARFSRAIDIQGQRIRELDLKSNPSLGRVSLLDANSCPESLQDHQKDLAIHAQPLRRKAAVRVAGTQTDLNRLNREQVFSLARLGYDSCTRCFGDTEYVIRKVDDPEFWEQLLSQNPPERAKDYDMLLSRIPNPVGFSQLVGENIRLAPRGGPEGRVVHVAVWVWNHKLICGVVMTLCAISLFYSLMSACSWCWTSLFAK